MKDTIVDVGQTVEAGDTVVILEATKIDNSVNAEKFSVVKSVHVATGAAVSGRSRRGD